MASKEIPHNKTSFSPSSNSTSSDSFTLETKFIVLNFMSRNPHERHPGCVYSSTNSSAGSDSVPFRFKDKDHQSFPSSPRKLVKTRNLGLLDQSFHTSEDNVSYRYQKEHNALLSLDESSNDSFQEHSSQVLPFRTSSFDQIYKGKLLKTESLDHGFNHGRYFIESDSSSISGHADGSATTPFKNYRQGTLESELSSDTGNLSYTSDADDEYESTTSSLFSSFSDVGGLASRQGDHATKRLSTVLSESDVETDVSTIAGDVSADVSVNHVLNAMLQMDVQSKDEERKTTDNKLLIENGDGKQIEKIDEQLQTVDRMEADRIQVCNSASWPNLSDSEGISIEDADRRKPSKKGDRTKLKLIIKKSQEWEEEQRYQIKQVLATMEDEVNDEMISLESEVEEAIKRRVIEPTESPFTAPVSPHTEAAMTLARIGDEIKDYYGDQLTMAVSGLCVEEQTNITYEKFKRVACSVIDHAVPGWRQVALLLVYGQSVAWRVAEFGYREFGGLVNNTVRLINELFSDFITSEGGWGAIMNYDSSLSSSLSPQHSSPEEQSPPHLSDHSASVTVSCSDEFLENQEVTPHNVSSTDQKCFQPAPDESAVDMVSYPSVTGNQSPQANRIISLADIHMTFSLSEDSGDNQNTVIQTNGSIENQTNFKPPPDECAMFRIENDLTQNNSLQNSDEDYHKSYSIESMPCNGGQNNNHGENGHPNSTQESEKSLSQECHDSNQIPSPSARNKQTFCSVHQNQEPESTSDSECSQPEPNINCTSDLQDSTPDALFNKSNNNKASLSNDSDVEPYHAVADLPEEPMNYNSSDEPSTETEDIHSSYGILRRISLIGTYVSFSVWIVGIILAGFSSRR